MATFIKLGKYFVNEDAVAFEVRAADHVVAHCPGVEAIHLHGDEAKEVLAKLEAAAAKTKPEVKPEARHEFKPIEKADKPEKSEKK